MYFYYNDILVAKNTKLMYKYGVTLNDWVMSCHTSYSNAEKALRGRFRRYEREAENMKRAIEAIKTGKRVYNRKEANGKYFEVGIGYQLGTYENLLNELNRKLSGNWKIVKLEPKEKYV